MTDALWYFGRGAGVSALVLFTLVVVLGIVVRMGRPLPGLPASPSPRCTARRA